MALYSRASRNWWVVGFLFFAVLGYGVWIPRVGEARPDLRSDVVKITPPGTIELTWASVFFTC